VIFLNKKDVLCITCTALLFSTMEVALKIAGTELDSFQITFIRFAIGGLVLLPFALAHLKKNSVKITAGDWLYFAFLGIVCICISMLLFQIAINNSNANLISVLICSNPLFVMIFSHFIVGDRFTKRKALVLLIGICGLIVAANPFHLSEGNSFFGIGCGLIASIAFALYTTSGKLRIQKFGGMTQTCFSFLIGSAVMLVIMLAMGRPVVAGINSSNILLVLYLGVAVTGIGYYIYFLAIASCGPANASIVFFMKPMFAPIIALVLLGEDITWNIILGVAMLLTGSVINMKTPAKAVPDNNIKEEAGQK